MNNNALSFTLRDQDAPRWTCPRRPTVKVKMPSHASPRWTSATSRTSPSPQDDDDTRDEDVQAVLDGFKRLSP
jgi:hypothetical protein